MFDRTPKNNVASGRRSVAFSEKGVWARMGDGWQHLHGSFHDLGYSIEWHDFSSPDDLDWSKTFHPDGVEICLNLAGRGFVRTGAATLELGPLTAGFYLQDAPRLVATRVGGERHQFITVELSFAFLARHLLPGESGLHRKLRMLRKRKQLAEVSEPARLTAEHQQMIVSLRHPPVYAAAQRLWYHAKALEVAAAIFYTPASGDELFCQRQKRQNQERVQKVIAILKENMTEALTLEEIGRRVGCSHFYLSRIFSQETGMSIFQYLRELRMDRAAELLREGRLNVTQVALEVGYSSPSHFSVAFHGAFGCCPGLYPLATPSQRRASRQAGTPSR